MGSERFKPVDWAEVRRRIARAQEALDAALADVPRRAQCKLQERAAEFERRLAALAAPRPTVEYLCFEVAGSRYAVESGHVSQVAKLCELERVPEAAAEALGLTCLRGALLPVLELPQLLGRSEELLPARGWAVVLGGRAGGEVALAVDRLGALVEGGRPPPTQQGRLVLFEDAELGSVLDGAALLSRNAPVRPAMG